ncbi:sulfotransferase [Celeribacter sp. ULVN23_4]
MARTSRRPKVFILGFNKTATTALHQWFKLSGYRSFHWGVIAKEKVPGRYLANVVISNVTCGRPPLETLEDFDCYSEFSNVRDDYFFEANYFFDKLYEAYPDAYFILNTRSTESWIKSRVRHQSNVFGPFIDRALRAMGQEQAVLERHWEDYKPKFEERMRAFFAARPEAKFCEYHISEDKPEKLVAFMQKDYTLPMENFGVHNAEATARHS